MFTFYVVSAGHDILGLTRAGEKSKPHDYKQNTKRKDLSKTRVLTAKSLNISDKKKQKKTSRPFKNIRWNTNTHSHDLKIALLNCKK